MIKARTDSVCLSPVVRLKMFVLIGVLKGDGVGDGYVGEGRWGDCVNVRRLVLTLHVPQAK